MTRPRLKRLLLASHVGLVALLAGLLLATGAGMFQASVRAQARAEVAQVALETGWGRSTMRRDGGGSANNYFGIKATGGWQGDRATHRTQEFSGGRMQSEVASFRAYASPAESFADYVRLLKTSPRYSEAVNSGGDGRRFAQSLQRAGYATDPQYAAKLTAIAEGPTLRRALAQLDGDATPATRA